MQVLNGDIKSKLIEEIMESERLEVVGSIDRALVALNGSKKGIVRFLMKEKDGEFILASVIAKLKEQGSIDQTIVSNIEWLELFVKSTNYCEHTKAQSVIGDRLEELWDHPESTNTWMLYQE